MSLLLACSSQVYQTPRTRSDRQIGVGAWRVAGYTRRQRRRTYGRKRTHFDR